MQITTIGLDIAKNVFQVHGIDAGEKVVVRKQLRRSQMLAFFEALPPCLVGMEACASSHCWARELTKLGHQVRLMPAKDVKAYVSCGRRGCSTAAAISYVGLFRDPVSLIGSLVSFPFLRAYLCRLLSCSRLGCRGSWGRSRRR